MRYRIHSGASVNVCEIDERGRLQVGGLHDEHADPSSDAQRRGCSGWPQASHHRMGKFSNDRRMRRSCIKPLAPLVRRNQDHATSRIIRSLMTALLASALPLPSLAAWGIESSPGGNGKGRQRAAVTANPISRLGSLDELERFGADPENRYAHVSDRHATGVLQAPQDRAKASPTFS
jgi:hypothetical protein